MELLPALSCWSSRSSIVVTWSVGTVSTEWFGVQNFKLTEWLFVQSAGSDAALISLVIQILLLTLSAIFSVFIKVGIEDVSANLQLLHIQDFHQYLNPIDCPRSRRNLPRVHPDEKHRLHDPADVRGGSADDPAAQRRSVARDAATPAAVQCTAAEHFE